MLDEIETLIITEDDDKRAWNAANLELQRLHAQEYKALYLKHAKAIAAARTQHLEPTIAERLSRLKETK